MSLDKREIGETRTGPIDRREAQEMKECTLRFCLHVTEATLAFGLVGFDS